MISKLGHLFSRRNDKEILDSEELFQRAKQYHNGTGVKQDLVKAVKLYQQSADMGNMKAKHNLALLHIAQEGGLTDKEQGRQMLEELIEAGVVNAMFNLGKLLQEGVLLAKDIDRGTQLLEDASRQGFGAASCQLGFCYINELKDSAKGLEYLKLAANQDYALANRILADMYEQGQFVEVDFKQSFMYLQRAAELDDPISQLKWGMISVEMMHQFNTGIAWVRKALKQGVGGAYEFLDSLGLVDEMSSDERVEHFLADIAVPTDQQSQEALDAAQKKFDQMYKCCEYGDPVAQFLLGFMAQWGIGMPKDQQQAVKLFRLSAEQGQPEAFNFLGMALINMGQFDEGNMYLSKGAEMGNREAVHNLGNSYYYARGVEQDVEKAVELWQRGAEMGNPDSMRTIGNCYLHGVGVECDVSKGIEWLTKAVELGCTEAIPTLNDAMRKLGNQSR